MKNKITHGVLALVLPFAAIIPVSTASAQGNLAPSGAPAPTMKTLAQIEPRVPISSLPYTINSPGSYYFTTNLTGLSGQNGIAVNCGNVAIDLNGFTLLGVAGSGAGIAVTTTFTNLVFRNGTVTGWGGNGIDSYSSGFPRNILIEKITVSANGANGVHTEAGSILRDCIAFGNTGNGLMSAGGEIIDCLSRNNGNCGFAAVNCSLLHCSAEYNSGHGFYLAASRALDCDGIYNSIYGFDCYGNGDEVRRCRSSYNSNDGVVAETGVGEMVVEDCEVSHNGGYGIYTFGGGNGGCFIARNNLILNNGPGIGISDNNNLVEDNHVLTLSGNPAISETSSSDTNNVVIKNVSMGFGSYNYIIQTPSDFGPLGTPSSLTSPWGNISR